MFNIIVLGCNNEERQQSSLVHFKSSIENIQKSFLLEPSGQPYGNMDEEKYERIMKLRKSAFNEAQHVDIKELNQINKELAVHFKNEYLRGLKLSVEGYEQSDFQKLNQGSMLINSWGNWYSSYLNELREE